MSVNNKIEIKCPKCGEKQRFDVWQCVNVTENKEMRDKVFSEEIFRFRCENCGVDSIVQYPFIYHDAENKFFVFFDGTGNFENVVETEGYITKTASNYLEFLETIKILEDKVDEERIKECKDKLLDKFKGNDKLKNIKNIYYTGTNNDKFEFFVPEINGKIAI